ncbi:MAG: hypothetical protein NZ811_01760 [Gammaproteobacteria bacterium]|nr:hypothetical protein [Gammaproteobacteria bacterium]
MVKMTEESNTSVSIWWLYIGAFLCCTGFGVIPGAIFIVYWAIMRLEGVKLGNSYTENNTENNYSVNIQDYHGGNGGSGGSGNGSNSSPKSNIKPKTKRPIKAIVKKTTVKKAVPINYVSNSNLERGK